MKNQSIIIISLIAVGVGLALGYALFNSPNDRYQSRKQTDANSVPTGMHRMPDGTMMGNSTSKNEMGMMNGMDHGSMMVKSERAFLDGMIPHHQEAVDTAKEVVARGGSTPQIKKLAEDIIVAQEREIAMMKEWYQNWYGVAYVAKPNDYTPMMRDLSALSGADLDRVFLADMVMHHMGAVMMAESVGSYIEHQEMTYLTKAIIETQVAEIKLMKEMLTGL